MAGFSDHVVQLVDDRGEPMHRAVLQCTERNGRQRSFNATSDSLGLVSLGLPDQSELDCIASPSDASGRTAARRVIALSEAFPTVLELPTGERMSGRVLYEDTSGSRPLRLAIVRLVDAEGLVWGYDLTDESGGWQISLEWGVTVSESLDTGAP